jgi:hypothetical protein
LPSNAGGSLKPRLLRLQKRILLTWSVAGDVAHNYEFAERLSDLTITFSKRKQKKE